MEDINLDPIKDEIVLVPPNPDEEQEFVEVEDVPIQEYDFENESLVVDDAQYKEVKENKILVDTESKEIIDISKMSMFEIICHEAKQRNIPVKNPKKNCNKCYERGYIGTDKDSGAPVPCKCIFPKEYLNQFNDQFHLNRSLKRHFDKKGIKYHAVN